MIQPDRRRHRSAMPTEAAHLYLAATARRRAHATLALADRDGLLLAASRTASEAEAVAAIAPLAFADGATPREGLLNLVTRGKPVYVWPMKLKGEPVYLAAIGGESDCPSGAAEALERILLAS